MPQIQLQPYPKRTPFFAKDGQIHEEWHRFFLSNQTLVNFLLSQLLIGTPHPSLMTTDEGDTSDPFIIPGPTGPAGVPGLQGIPGLDGDLTFDEPLWPLFPNGTTGAGAVALATNPAFLGIPTAPTPAVADNSTALATTAYVTTAIGISSTAWTPVDNSGAGLAITNNGARVIVLGKLVHATAQIVYPATGSGLTAIIGGIGTNAVSTANNIFSASAESNFGSAVQVIKRTGTDDMLFTDVTGAALTNAQLSGKTMIITTTYFSA